MSAMEVDSSREACAKCSAALPPAEVHAATDRFITELSRQAPKSSRSYNLHYLYSIYTIDRMHAYIRSYI